MTHDQLVHRAIKWLWSGRCIGDAVCSVVVSELTSGGSETPDVIGFWSGFSIVIECKASRQDFSQEKHKAHHVCKDFMGDYRYYMTPPNLLNLDEIPPKWGLLEAHGNTIHTMRMAEYLDNKNYRDEIAMFVSILRRFNPKVKGVNVKHYTKISNNKPRATLGIARGGDSERCSNDD